MPVVRKFDFSLSFDPAPPAPAPLPEPVAVVVEPPPPPPPPEPTFSAAELEAARRQAYEEGRMAGESEAMAGLERQLGETTRHLGTVLGLLAAQQGSMREVLEHQAAEATLMLARKLFPALAERSGTLEIEAMLEDAFHQAIEEPRLVVRCAPAIKDALEPLSRQIAERVGFEGRLLVVGDARLAAGDCRVEWADGGIERSPGRMLDAIEAVVEQGLAEFDLRQGIGIGALRPIEEAAA